MKLLERFIVSPAFIAFVCLGVTLPVSASSRLEALSSPSPESQMLAAFNTSDLQYVSVNYEPANRTINFFVRKPLLDRYLLPEINSYNGQVILDSRTDFLGLRDLGYSIGRENPDMCGNLGNCVPSGSGEEYSFIRVNGGFQARNRAEYTEVVEVAASQDAVRAACIASIAFPPAYTACLASAAARLAGVEERRHFTPWTDTEGSFNIPVYFSFRNGDVRVFSGGVNASSRNWFDQLKISLVGHFGRDQLNQPIREGVRAFSDDIKPLLIAQTAAYLKNTLGLPDRLSNALAATISDSMSMEVLDGNTIKVSFQFSETENPELAREVLSMLSNYSQTVSAAIEEIDSYINRLPEGAIENAEYGDGAYSLLQARETLGNWQPESTPDLESFTDPDVIDNIHADLQYRLNEISNMLRYAPDNLASELEAMEREQAFQSNPQYNHLRKMQEAFRLLDHSLQTAIMTGAGSFYGEFDRLSNEFRIRKQADEAGAGSGCDYADFNFRNSDFVNRCIGLYEEYLPQFQQLQQRIEESRATQ